MLEIDVVPRRIWSDGLDVIVGALLPDVAWLWHPTRRVSSFLAEAHSSLLLLMESSLEEEKNRDGERDMRKVGHCHHVCPEKKIHFFPATTTTTGGAHPAPRFFLLLVLFSPVFFFIVVVTTFHSFHGRWRLRRVFFQQRRRLDFATKEKPRAPRLNGGGDEKTMAPVIKKTRGYFRLMSGDDGGERWAGSGRLMNWKKKAKVAYSNFEGYRLLQHGMCVNGESAAGQPPARRLHPSEAQRKGRRRRRQKRPKEPWKTKKLNE